MVFLCSRRIVLILRKQARRHLSHTVMLGSRSRSKNFSRPARCGKRGGSEERLAICALGWERAARPSVAVNFTDLRRVAGRPRPDRRFRVACFSYDEQRERAGGGVGCTISFDFKIQPVGQELSNHSRRPRPPCCSLVYSPAVTPVCRGPNLVPKKSSLFHAGAASCCAT